MKKYMTVAALLVAGTAFANAWQIDAEFKGLTVPADFYAGDYTFEFNVVDMPTTYGDQIVLGFYRGGGINDTYGYNAIVLNTDAMTLQVGRGRAYDTLDSATGIDLDTSFTFKDSVTFTTKIEEGVDYMLTVVGANTSMTPTLSWTDAAGVEQTETLASYNGNMNSYSATLTSAVIPEPSAFGLLAGLGALALVGARRRRR